tara:strand:- start:326 stop:1549 length:1224 start_codon:yes stop_codon:yes gene_type:complete
MGIKEQKILLENGAYGPPYVATNQLGARDKFLQRLNYKENATLQFPTRDLWYARPYYGKVDENGNAIMPDESYLVQLKGTKDALFLMNFVADAFNDFSSYFKDLQIQYGFTPENSSLASFTPKKAWNNPRQGYHELMEKAYRQFTRIYLTTEMSRKIIDFKSFFKEFATFLRTFSKVSPVTNTSYILSTKTSPLCSAMMVEIGTEDPSNDIMKDKKWISERFIKEYALLAQEFGFKIDKNIPWRLIADIQSPRLGKYMEKYCIDWETLFRSDYYTQTYELDVLLLREYILGMYNSYVQSIPLVTTPSYCKNSLRIKNKTIVRKELTTEQYDAIIPTEKWIDLYVQIRDMETGGKLSPAQKRAIIGESVASYKASGLEASFKMVNDKFMRKNANLIKRGHSDISDFRR